MVLDNLDQRNARLATEKTIHATLNVLQILISENKALFVDAFVGVMTCLQPLLFPAKSTLHSQTAPSPRLQGVSKTKLPWRKFPGDSDVSETEGSSGKIPHQGRVQSAALICLQLLLRAHPKLVFPKWPTFFGEFNSATLLSLLQMDEPFRVKIAAAGAISAFLESSKPYLSVAEASRTQSAKLNFTSLSEKLSKLLASIHLSILTALSREVNNQVVVALFKIWFAPRPTID
ncbi:hypothetical protein DFJ73DRAFT_555839 [Zopfochytrium polystomum]|nr:hypothetical protein DFJ73DRAFT_555839 [Zopfochytrium polystomum]